ncbi:MAG: hypothetical protein AABX83_04205 [Nanoarchaeota archaeon]
MISEKEKEKIKLEAKKILDNFASSLEHVKVQRESVKKYAGGYRKEKNGEKCDEDFRISMFENAPSKEGDCIIAEKKKW